MRVEVKRADELTKEDFTEILKCSADWKIDESPAFSLTLEGVQWRSSPALPEDRQRSIERAAKELKKLQESDDENAYNQMRVKLVGKDKTCSMLVDTDNVTLIQMITDLKWQIAPIEVPERYKHMVKRVMVITGTFDKPRSRSATPFIFLNEPMPDNVAKSMSVEMSGGLQNPRYGNWQPRFQDETHMTELRCMRIRC